MNNKDRLSNEILKRELFFKLLKRSFLVASFMFAVILPSQTQANEFGNTETKIEQQSRNIITGVVTDQSNNPVPGVTVQVVGKDGGVITDVDGKYSIEAEPNNQLRFQFLGMKTVTISVGNLTTHNITMMEDIELLDEVTVTAFATQKKESVVSSIETINPKELKMSIK